MSDAPIDMILPVLKKIQQDIATMQLNITTLQKSVDDRFDSVDAQFRKQRRDMAGMLVMMKSTAGHFDERVTSLESRVSALERRPA